MNPVFAIWTEHNTDTLLTLAVPSLVALLIGWVNSIKIDKNTQITQDVSGKAEAAASKADASDKKMDHVVTLVNGQDAKHTEERQLLQKQVSDLQDVVKTNDVKQAIHDEIKRLGTALIPVPVTIANPDPVPVVVEKKG